MISKHILKIKFFKLALTFFFHTVKWFHIISNNSVKYKYNQLIGLVSRVFANGPGDWGSIPGRVIPKT